MEKEKRETLMKLAEEIKEMSLKIYNLLEYDELQKNSRICFRTIEKEESTDILVEEVVTSYLLKLGIPVHLLGFSYLRTAIILTLEDNNVITSVTKLLYPSIAKQYHSTPSRVERAIRHGIETCWNRGNLEIINDIFQYSTNSKVGRATNSEFIALLADKIRLELKAE